MRHQAGFRSANIHLSTDRTRVVNYAQWDSAEAYRAMLADPTTQQHMAEAAALAISFDPHLYTVESVHETLTYRLAAILSPTCVVDSFSSPRVARWCSTALSTRAAASSSPT